MIDADPSIRWVGPDGKEMSLEVPMKTGSLALWLALNVDPSAKGRRGLAILSEAGRAMNTSDWREEFLLRTRQWSVAANKLKGFASWTRDPTGGLEVLAPEDTLKYIRWTRKLLRFAEMIYMSGGVVKTV